MKKYNKINRNKQKQQNRKMNISKENEIYKEKDHNKIFTVVQLTSGEIDMKIDLPYNFVTYYGAGMSQIELSYLIRCSDLLILTVGAGDIDNDLIGVIKRYMPSTIIVYARKFKGIANGIAKVFGGIKICESLMVSHLLKNFETMNTQLCKKRPFMVGNEFWFEEGYVYVRGFMKQGLRSNKVVINGVHEGTVETVSYNGIVIDGEQLNGHEDERLIKVFEIDQTDNFDINLRKDDNFDINLRKDDNLKTMTIEQKYDMMNKGEEYDLIDNDKYDSDGEEEYDLIDGEEEYDLIDGEEEYDLIDNDKYDLIDNDKFTTQKTDFPDLIEKYKDFRGILDPSTCDFSNQEKPEYYKEMIFVKNDKFAQNLLALGKSIIPPNTVVELKIKIEKKIDCMFIVLFGLLQFEEKQTVWNFEFTNDAPLPKELLIDNGYRIYRAATMLTSNLAHNLFQEDPTLNHGIVSFIGPFSYFSTQAYAINENTIVKLYNGDAKDRIFFECIELTGRPIKIYKRYCVVRGMFYTKEQVEYFNNIRIQTKSGDRGFIKKPLGTKGLFKAYFTRPVKHNETIKMSLYRRIFLQPTNHTESII